MTVWLTSGRLNAWEYGTLGERLTPGCWGVVFARLDALVVPELIGLVPLVALAVGPARRRAWTLAAVAATLLPIVLFFNLYVQHDYYFAALTPVAALAAGSGLAAAGGRSAGRWLATLAVAAVCTIQCWPATHQAFYDPAPTQSFYRIAEVVKRITRPDQYVLVQGDDWNPAILYTADRRGLMWSVRPGGPTPDDLLHQLAVMGPEHFGAIVYTRRAALAGAFPDAKPVAQVAAATVAKVN